MIQYTTRNRPHVLEHSLDRTRANYDGFIIVIDDNSDTKEANQNIAKKYDCAYLYNDKRRGIPRSKERGFRSLLSFDYQFWFDDDCFLKGPIDRFKEAMEYQGHLLYLREWAHIKIKEKLDHGLISYSGATACFMTFRKDMYDDVKGFQAGFTKYGHWHHMLSQKMAKYGLDEYVSIDKVWHYLHSFDIDKIPPGFSHNFSSCMSKEERLDELQKWKK